MSLDELIRINKIVFGVDKVKIKPYYKYATTAIANQATYYSGLYSEFNFSNRFIYAGQGIYNFIFVIQMFSGGSYSYNRFNIVSNSYVNLEDVRKAAMSQNYNNIVGISFIYVVPINYVPTSNNISIKDTEPKVIYTMQLYTPNQSLVGGQRVYLLEYDPDVLLLC